MRANAWEGMGKELKIKQVLCELTWREDSVSPALIVSIRYLVYVTLYRWPSGVQVWMRLSPKPAH
jgi:hypothetical protein